MAKATKKPAKSKSGPKPELFKIDGMDWKAAVKKATLKKRPAAGWPNPQ